ncbi:MAG: DUF58 domain-containing protein [Planctomycetota bacterium]
MRAVALGLLVLSLTWGLRTGSRPVTSFGVAATAVLAALWLYPRRAARGLRVQREMSPVVCEEDEIPVAFTLENRSRLPLVAPEVVDRFPPDRIDPRRAYVYPLLGARRAAHTGYRGRCDGRRGPYRIGPAVVRATCPAGLFEAEWHEREGAKLIVLPALERIDPLDRESRGRAGSFGGRGRREAGEGDIPLGVREYRPGDALRRIHWPTSARRGRLSILEYERQLARRATVLVDLSRQGLRGLGRQANVEVSLRVAAAVTGACLRRGDRVAFLGRSQERVEVPAGRGDAQLIRVLERLALLKPEGEVPLSTVLDEEVPGFVPGQLVVVVVGDVEGDGAATLPALERALARGCEVVAVLLDPATFPRIYDAACATPRTKVHELAEDCRVRGVTPYVVRAAQPLAEAFLAPYAGRPRVRITQEMLA